MGKKILVQLNIPDFAEIVRIEMTVLERIFGPININDMLSINIPIKEAQISDLKGVEWKLT